MTYVCAICGFEINKIPNVYDKRKDEHYHHTCWYFQEENEVKND
jgi:DNA-directed RNA polymerase subunit RPC12/RpoP